MRRGFTLLEILIALGLLGTAMVAVAGAIDTSARRVLAARENLVAARVASALLHEVLATKEPAPDAGVSEAHPDFTWEVRIDEEPFHIGELELAARTLRIEVEVRWKQGQRSILLVSRRPPRIEGGRR